jgi:hypothetical protein
VLGGYALAYAFTAGAAGALAAGGLLSRSDAVLAASMPSFLVYLAAVVYAFGARSASRAWTWIGGASGLFGIAAVLLRTAL